jgi:hypothetical protein
MQENGVRDIKCLLSYLVNKFIFRSLSLSLLYTYGTVRMDNKTGQIAYDYSPEDVNSPDWYSGGLGFKS